MNNRIFAVAAAFLVAVSCARAVDDLEPVAINVDKPIVAEFIDDMVSEHEFDRDALRALLGEAKIKVTLFIVLKPTANWPTTG